MISAVVLAAGLSSRMGQNKLLLPLGNQTIIEHVVEKVLKSHVDEVVVVLGKDADRISDILKSWGVKVVFNANYEAGQSTSVKSGLDALDKKSEGVLFLMGDQPLIQPGIIDEMILTFLAFRDGIVLPVCNNKRGNPVLFSKRYYSALSSICGDKGGREIIREHSEDVLFFEIDDPSFFYDVDDDEKYKVVQNCFNRV